MRFTPTPPPLRAGQIVTYSQHFLERRAPFINKHAQYERGVLLFIYHGIATVAWENGTRTDLRETDITPANLMPDE
jgi:hypothetical protein